MTWQQNLMDWYRQNRRDLPWRRTKSSYKIWVAEIMLQQTRVDTVIPYFYRFLQMFPDIRSLAEADLQDVLMAWEGLGYYARIRNMHRAARLMVEKNNAEFPGSFDEIIALPGIGRYTAGAIASIAFGLQVPVVDGNVIRVLARVFAIALDVSSAKAKNQFWQIAEELVPENSPGDFNQALMELGATVCLTQKPLCGQCPLGPDCQAKRANRQAEFPLRSPKAATPHYQIGAGLIWRDDRLLITRRPENTMLGGLWEFPGGKQEEGESIEQCVEREIFEELGVAVEVGEHFMTVKHAYSHFRITLAIFHCQWLFGEPVCKGCSDFHWVGVEELTNFPFPRANKRIVERLVG